MSGSLANFETRQRSSGLLVPSHLASVPEGEPAPDVARDADGRRRIVLSDEARRHFAQLVKALGPRDLAFFLACRNTRTTRRVVKDAATGEAVTTLITESIEGACGGIMLREGEGTGDPGFGCQCARVHFVASIADARPS